jgi:hypothetical protein
MIEPWHTRDSGAHRYEWADPERLILEFDLIRTERSGEVTAELLVTSTAPAIGGTIHHARVNLVSTRSRAELAKHLGTRVPALSLDWSQVIEYACRETVLAYRAGAPAILLRDAPEPEAGAFLIPPFVLARMPTLMFGDGGSAKSLIALAAGLTVHTGRPLLGLDAVDQLRVGFLDWEMDAVEHRVRARSLLGEESDLVYVPCARPLAEDVDRLRRIVRQHAIGYLIVDSVALACDGPPEAAEVAGRFFGALRELGLGSLLVAHVNRSGDTDRPFGSAFWHNGARLTWYVKRESVIGSNRLTVGLFNKKSNVGPLAAPMGFDVTFAPDDIGITRTDVADIPDIAQHVPVRFRLEAEMRLGAKTITELATGLGTPVDTVKKTLERHEGRAFVRMPGTDGVYRWGLASRGVA